MTASQHMVQANGLRFRTLADGPATGELYILLHGFPEGAESWSRQTAFPRASICNRCSTRLFTTTSVGIQHAISSVKGASIGLASNLPSFDP